MEYVANIFSATENMIFPVITWLNFYTNLPETCYHL